MTNPSQQLLRRYIEQLLVGAIGAGLTLYVNDKIQDNKIVTLEHQQAIQNRYMEQRLDVIQQEIKELRQVILRDVK